jgi:hypothetical protein
VDTGAGSIGTQHYDGYVNRKLNSLEAGSPRR